MFTKISATYQVLHMCYAQGLVTDTVGKEKKTGIILNSK